MDMEYVRLEGPLNVTGLGDTPSRRQIFVCRPARPGEEESCAKKILAALARRAYRRPVTNGDIETLFGSTGWVGAKGTSRGASRPRSDDF